MADPKLPQNTASNTVPLADSGTGAAGTSTQYAKGDHRHPAGEAGPSASNAIPLADSGTGAAGVSTEYARGDHRHPAGGAASAPLIPTSATWRFMDLVYDPPEAADAPLDYGGYRNYTLPPGGTWAYLYEGDAAKIMGVAAGGTIVRQGNAQLTVARLYICWKIA